MPLTLEEATKQLKDAKAKSFCDYLKFIRDTPQLCMVQDNGWYWVEFEGEAMDGTAGELFTGRDEMNDLMMLAGIS
jgi:hypothetical protein